MLPPELTHIQKASALADWGTTAESAYFKFLRWKLRFVELLAMQDGCPSHARLIHGELAALAAGAQRHSGHIAAPTATRGLTAHAGPTHRASTY